MHARTHTYTHTHTHTHMQTHTHTHMQTHTHHMKDTHTQRHTRMCTDQSFVTTYYIQWEIWQLLAGQYPKTQGCSSVGRASNWHTAEAGSIPQCGKGLFSQSQLSVQILLQCPDNPYVQTHALTSVHTLKIPNIGSHTFDWTNVKTAHTVVLGMGNASCSCSCCSLTQVRRPKFLQGTNEVLNKLIPSNLHSSSFLGMQARW